jgi:hypothetical protein
MANRLTIVVKILDVALLAALYRIVATPDEVRSLKARPPAVGSTDRCKIRSTGHRRSIDRRETWSADRWETR